MESNSKSPARRRPRVLLIGWDAADWKIITPLVEQGLMPNMARFVEEGVMGNVASLTPMLSPMLWTSIATGKLADKHQILGFAEPDASGGVRPVSSLARRCRAIWNILSDRGLKAGAINWFASHPAERINGFVVTDHFPRAVAPPDAAWPPVPFSVHPAELLDKACSLRIHPGAISRQQVEYFIPRLDEFDAANDDHVKQLRTLLAQCGTVHAAATWLMQEHEWDFLGVYYDTIDRVGHAFMEFHPPRREQVDAGEFERFKDVVTACYRFYDMMLGRLMDLAGEDTTVIIVSDHGFQSDHLRPEGSSRIDKGQPVAWHRRYGVLAMHGPNMKKDERVYGASLLDITPTILMLLGLPVAADMDGKPLTQVIDAEPGSVTLETIDTYETGEPIETSSNETAEALVEAQMLEHLADLGYIENASVENIRLDRYRNLGQVYASTGRDELAMEQFHQALARKPDDVASKVAIASCLLNLGRFDEGEALIREVIGDNKDAPWANLYLGRIALNRGQVDAALDHFKRAERSEPANPVIHNQIAVSYMHQARWKDAMRSFERALDIDSENAEAYDGLGVCLRQLGRPAQAVEKHMRSIALLHGRPQVHFHLGLALAEVGRLDWAIRAFHVALELAPDMAAAHRCLAELYERGKKDPEKAEEHRDAAARIDGSA
ncbi:MAG: hypothetical protein C4547_13175 [Phycisphaerales bacterium]|nr:MAG: hypothetical protein C4547_13175 [Phycisphaerales bacterium]